MAETETDEFGGESGLKDDFDGNVAEAYFDEGEWGTQLILKLDCEDGDEYELRLGVGDRWTTKDGGETVEHPDDKPNRRKKFNHQSKYQRFVTAALETGEDAAKVLRERSVKYDRLGPRVAALWVGTSWHFEVDSEEKTIKDRDTGEMKTVTVNYTLPTAFLGVKGEDGGGEKKASSSKSGAGASGASGVSSDDPLSTLDAKVAGKVKALAKTKEYSDWLDAVLELDGVADSPAVMAVLSDEDFYEGLK